MITTSSDHDDGEDAAMIGRRGVVLVQGEPQQQRRPTVPSGRW